jgi:hypothetical protein
MKTLELMNDVARHLTGKDVEVNIREPVTRGANGETWIDWRLPHPVQIAISQRAAADGEKYLNVFLHEVAHARLHTARMDASGPVEALHDDAGVLEIEARALAAKWKRYADFHFSEYEVMAWNEATAILQKKLLALLSTEKPAKR